VQRRRADKTIMKCVIAISTALVFASVSAASAQSTQSKPLADVAKAEEARRQQVRKPARVITNNDLRPDNSKGIAPPPSSAATPAANGSPSTTTPAAPAADAGPAKDQAYWSGRIRTARAQLQRQQLFADSLQTRINSLTTDFVNRDDPAQRAKIETDRQTALAELEKVKKEITDTTKEIAAIEDEARRAGVPPGWLRPAA
jgi:hypothetical protein